MSSASNTAQFTAAVWTTKTPLRPLSINCLFTDNTATYGGAIDNFSHCTPVFINCTFSRNSATVDGDAFYNENHCSPVVKNSILWDNSANEIFNDATSSITVSYSNVKGGWSGTANLGSDPLFLDPLNDNFRLPFDSPAVESGSNAAIPIGFIKDLDNTTRIAPNNCIYNPIIDRGAYEFERQRVGDFSDNCVIDFVDFAIFAENWLSDDTATDIAPPYRDGIVNINDLLLFMDHWLEIFP